MENDNATESSHADSGTVNTENPSSHQASDSTNAVEESSSKQILVERQNSTASAKSIGGSDIKGPSAGKEKINILLKPVGDAPILKQKLWAVPPERLVSQITEFVKKYLKLEKSQNLFVFVNQLFAPAPDQCVRDLYECFGSDNKLVLHYSTTVAWG